LREDNAVRDWDLNRHGERLDVFLCSLPDAVPACYTVYQNGPSPWEHLWLLCECIAEAGTAGPEPSGEIWRDGRPSGPGHHGLSLESSRQPLPQHQTGASLI
jgi:hypothetical protein